VVFNKRFDLEEITNFSPKFLFSIAPKLANDGAEGKKDLWIAAAPPDEALRTAIASIFYFIGETSNFYIL